ncbi:hypothetical protein E2C01_038232 [Portunus trituberculatus]|uniref:Uncharacterized protein n=2 Tax=Portunus trituberculatus TaxID=210409 RepID=A0A5B7FGA4_PORTR|nr:hypothetical protein [Portunus trituberculatus]
MFGVSPAAVQNILSAEDTCVGDLGKRRPIYDLIIGAVTWTQDFRHLYRAVEDLTLNQLQSLSTANVKIEGDRPDNELIIRGVL